MKNLSREEVKQVIEGRGKASRVPILFDMWIYDNIFDGSQEARENWLKDYPRDISFVDIDLPDAFSAPEDDPDYMWAPRKMEQKADVGIDAQCVIEDWDDTEEFYARFPSPEYRRMIRNNGPEDGRYRLGRAWFWLFERLWSLRGMENALTDFYLYPDEIHELFQRLTDFYKRALERALEEAHIDGFFISDDIGTQTGPFFSLDIFREFFKPYYKQLIDRAHELGVHMWLHTCGNIEIFLPEFIEIGLDVIHPIQKYTMDEKEIAEKYGDKICILAGFDVQQTIPFGTVEDVKNEVHYLRKTFERPEGRFMLTMGNGSTPDWKLESLDALYGASVDELEDK